jgi:AraC-like DNA-binding protein
MKQQIDVRFWRDPGLEGVEICRVRDSNHVFPNHVHDQIYAIGLLSGGASYVFGPRKSDTVVSTGEITLINPGQVHSGVPVGDDRITYRMVYLSISRMKTAAEQLREGSEIAAEFRRPVIRDPRLFSRLNHLTGLLTRTTGQLEKESALLEALSALLFRHGGIAPARMGGNNERTAVRRAREFLAEELDRKLSLEAVAGAAGLSPYHFLRVFRNATGLSPHVFRTQRRVDRAAALLRGGLPIAEVALETGFADQSHFTHTFRRYTGATPGQFVDRK